jgi:hypothetical protein
MSQAIFKSKDGEYEAYSAVSEQQTDNAGRKRNKMH